MALIGIGNGGSSVTRLMGVLSSCDAEKQAVIQAASWTLESTGLALGITIASTVFEKVSREKLRTQLVGRPELLQKLTMNFGVLRGLEGKEKEGVVDVYMKALRTVFLVAMAEMVVSAVISFMMRNNKIEDDEDEGERV